MYAFRKIGYLIVAVILIGVAAFIPSRDGQTAGIPDACVGTVFSVPAFDTASPAMEGYMELTISGNVVSAAPVSWCRTVLPGRSGSCPLPDLSGKEVPRSCCQDTIPGRMADYFVFALERIII